MNNDEFGMPSEETTILALSGSLRRDSFNSFLVQCATRLAPPGVLVQPYDRLRELPPYDQDEDGVEVPEPVADLRAKVRQADGLLIFTPEYNYSFPGQLKNLVDWLSRPAGPTLLAGKPVAVGGASITHFGTVRAQLALRQVFLWTDSRLVTKPELHLGEAHEMFDAAGALVDDGARELLADLVTALVELIADTRKLAIEAS